MKPLMDQNGTIAEPSGYKDITAHFNSTTDRRDQTAIVQENNKKKEIEFKAFNILLICFFLWILYVTSSPLLTLLTF